VILLDAYALIALAADEPAATEVEHLLRQGGSAVTSVNLAEAIDVTQRLRGLPAEDVRGALEPLMGETVRVLSQGEDDAWRAAYLRLRHYERRTSALSLADCFLLAAARPDDSIATSDPALVAAARAEGIGVRALADSSGRAP
jgi:predicted nucleic acid-binding protein